MNATNAKKVYVQKYVASWESEPLFKGWLKQSPDRDSTKAFCAFCKTTLVAHRKGLQDHATSKKHEQSMKNQEVISNLPKIDKFAKLTLTESRKIAELKIAAYVAEHGSISAIDHLSLIIKNLDKNSQILQDIKLHRTKCSAVTKNLLSPCILEEMINDVGDSYYSLIIDESTTIDTKKVLCLMIRYFSQAKKKIVTTFYRLIEMKAGTADAIATAIIDQLKIDHLKADKLLGLGVDGASVNVGKNHSVTTLLKNINPELVVVKCICHSLHLAAEEACKILPRYLDFMVRETHNWFSVSTKRQLEYAEIYKTLEDKVPKKIVGLSNTRWLVRIQAVDAILDQWDALQLHFKITQSNKERCYTASQLYSMYCDKENKLYLRFLSTALKNIMALNRFFQSSTADPVKLFEDLNNCIYSVLQVLVVPSQLMKISRFELAEFNFKEFCMPADCINFGYEFNILTKELNSKKVLEIKERGKDFLITLVTELQKRVPENIKLLDEMSTFSPQKATSQVKADITDIASKFTRSLCSNVSSVVKEWNLLHTIKINNTTSTESFWAEVNDITDAGGNKRFGCISKLALGLLILPFSNAAVERAFSILNIIKDKLRNRMSIQMVEAIMHVRCTLNVECHNFKPTAVMLKRFNSETIYLSVTDDDANVLELFSDK